MDIEKGAVDIEEGKSDKSMQEKNNLVPVRNKQRIGCFYNYHAETEDHNRITTFLPTTLLLLIIFTILQLHISSSPASF